LDVDGAGAVPVVPDDDEDVLVSEGELFVSVSLPAGFSAWSVFPAASVAPVPFRA
jgi:hypothetical protein